MVFNSLEFLLFFPIVAILYFLLPGRYRWFWLLIASCVFYMAFIPQYILVLFALITVDFFLAQLTEKAQGRKRTLLFFGSVLANVGTLFIFKYFNFFNANVAALAELIHWNYPIGLLEIGLPLGLSFHIFQSLSYVTEVYKGKYTAERHFGIYALFVMFFPQLVAGPIERPQHMLPQFHKVHTFDWQRILSGLQLMGWGLFKKVVIADRVSVGVDYIYQNISSLEGVSMIGALLLFAFQLYCDFSGYSDIAVGAARVLGFDLTRNFTRPYFSTSIGEFWRRWHISLSNWFRDYLYYPLFYAGKNKTQGRLIFCLFVTFLVSGLWHGAGWTYVTMGALHGFYLVAGLVTKKWRVKYHLPYALQMAYTFMLVCFGWVFFRASDLNQAFSLFAHLFTGWSQGLGHVVDLLSHPITTFGMSRIEVSVTLLAVATLIIVEVLHERMALGTAILKQPLFVRSFVYASLVLGIVVFGVFRSTQFIYFQF